MKRKSACKDAHLTLCISYFRIKNQLNPAWTTTFAVDYTFGKEIKFNVGIFDETTKAKKTKSMGSVVFEIGEVLGARGNIKAKKLRDGGTVFARVTEAAKVEYGTLNLNLSGHKLKNVDGFFSKSDPFFIINSQVDAAGGRVWHPVYRSETIKNDLNPKWKACSIPVEKLCDGNKNKPILIEVFDWEKSGKHQPMGKFETSVSGLVSAQAMTTPGSGKEASLSGMMSLQHKGKSYGKILVGSAILTGENLTPPQPALASEIAGARYESTPAAAIAPASAALAGAASAPALTSNSSLPPPMAPPPTPQRWTPGNKPRFVNYLEGGTEISLGVAIDFTGSNGDPRRPGTLHHMHPDGQLNDYEKALTAIGSIVARYDDDQMFPLWGFGAKYGGVVQHCFQVGKSSELKGVPGMLEGYRETFKTGLIMSGPTVFAEAIQVAALQAQSQQEANQKIGKQAYTILLILTDGAVTDIEQTKQAIRYASSAPLSIVIVGVGNADFSRMQFLDDFQRDEGGRTRDIVQFVEFFRHRHSRQALTRETLDEIPDQLVSYFYDNGMMPLPPVTGSKLNVFEEDYNEDEDIDLTVDINEEGEISLENEQEAYFDGQTYGTINDFLPPAMAPPASFQGGAASAPPAPYRPQAQSNAPTAYSPPHGAQPHSSQYAGQPPGQYGAPPQQFQQPPPQPSSSIPGRPLPPSNGAVPTAAVIVPSVVHIQAPPGSYPGMQLQVQNPTTGQFQVVTIPENVPPGGTFAIGL
jgi:hypothetical protein